MKESNLEETGTIKGRSGKLQNLFIFRELGDTMYINNQKKAL